MKIKHATPSKLPITDTCISCKSVMELELEDFNLVEYHGYYLNWDCDVCGALNSIYEGDSRIDNRIVKLLESKIPSNFLRRMMEKLSQ